MTLMLLWLEYRANEPDGFGYSRFCGLYGDTRRANSAHHGASRVAEEKERGGPRDPRSPAPPAVAPWRTRATCPPRLTQKVPNVTLREAFSSDG